MHTPLTRLTRRLFLRRLTLAGAALAAVATCPPVLPSIWNARAATPQGEAVTRTYLAMGTFVAMTVVHESTGLAEEAMGRALEEIHALEAQLTRFRADSALAVLNAQGRLAGPPPELAAVISQSRAVHALSAGAFDPTVLPILELVAEHVGRDGDTMVPEADLRLALERTGLERVDSRGRTLSMAPGMALTLDGVAKGCIVDRAAGVLAKAGAARFLINAGGDIRCAGGGWTVAVQDPAGPRDGSGGKTGLRLDHGAVATSGGYEISFGRQGLYNHVVDPRTGHSPLLTASATVAAPTAAEADALSTAALVMRPRRAMGMIRSLPGRHCLLVAADGARLADPLWPEA